MAKKRATSHCGLLLVNKPSGRTSFDVVRLVKRVFATGQVGHAGTLDPLATGLLVVAIGGATRLVRFVQAMPKVYRARVVFGARSLTDDAEGPFEPIAMAAPDAPRVRAALAALEGIHDQMPPAFSAKKIDGERAYALARAGETPAMRPARVVAYRLALAEFAASAAQAAAEAPPGVAWADIEATVGSGYYVRSMARDLGAALGGAAYLGGLHRGSIGSFRAADGIAWDELEAWVARAPSREAPGDAGVIDEAGRRLASPYRALEALPALRATDDEVRLLFQGKRLPIDLERLEGAATTFEAAMPTEATPRDALAVASDAAGPAMVIRREDRRGWKIDLNLMPLRAS